MGTATAALMEQANQSTLSEHRDVEGTVVHSNTGMSGKSG